jgi:putative chitinase
VADTAGENGGNDVYLEAEAAIEESEAAEHQFDVTSYQLSRIMPNLPTAKLGAYWPYLNAAMQKYEINTPLRAAAFLAQLAHESGEFRWMEEIWGPTAAQRGYEGRADLGNTQQGDGKRFKGRGPIQITGRDGYRRAGQALGIDLENNPDLASKPEYAFQIAGWYWSSRNLNALADQGTVSAFRQVTKKINGGYNGWDERFRYYQNARAALGLERDVPA